MSTTAQHSTARMQHASPVGGATGCRGLCKGEEIGLEGVLPPDIQPSSPNECMEKVCIAAAAAAAPGARGWAWPSSRVNFQMLFAITYGVRQASVLAREGVPQDVYGTHVSQVAPFGPAEIELQVVLVQL